MATFVPPSGHQVIRSSAVRRRGYRCATFRFGSRPLRVLRSEVRNMKTIWMLALPALIGVGMGPAHADTYTTSGAPASYAALSLYGPLTAATANAGMAKMEPG